MVYLKQQLKWCFLTQQLQAEVSPKLRCRSTSCAASLLTYISSLGFWVTCWQCSSWTCCCVKLLPPSWLLPHNPAGSHCCAREQIPALHPWFWQTTACPVPGEAAALHGSTLESLWNLWGYKIYVRKGVWWVSRVIWSEKTEIWQLLWEQCCLKSRGHASHTKCKVDYVISYMQIMPVKEEIIYFKLSIKTTEKYFSQFKF